MSYQTRDKGINDLIVCIKAKILQAQWTLARSKETLRVSKEIHAEARQYLEESRLTHLSR
jgi:hypothetical protein